MSPMSEHKSAIAAAVCAAALAALVIASFTQSRINAVADAVNKAGVTAVRK